jgi:hypothetical protein
VAVRLELNGTGDPLTASVRERERVADVERVRPRVDAEVVDAEIVERRCEV